MIFLIVERPNNEPLCIVPAGLLAETDSYRLYLGRGENSADPFLCRVVKNQTLNGLCFAELKWLKALATLSEKLEQSRIEKQGDDGRRIHYDWLFPVCEQSFSSDKLGDRRINVLSILDASLDEFIPLTKLKADTMVDAKSAAWILGRFLKLQAFLDEPGSYQSLDFNPDLVLISPKNHRIVYIGWFDDLVRGGDRSQTRVELISKLNINRMLYTVETWVEKDSTPGEEDFLNWLKDARNRFTNGYEAHEAYYSFLHELWASGYHPFTFKKDGVWKNVSYFA